MVISIIDTDGPRSDVVACDLRPSWLLCFGHRRCCDVAVVDVVLLGQTHHPSYQFLVKHVPGMDYCVND